MELYKKIVIQKLFVFQDLIFPHGTEVRFDCLKSQGAEEADNGIIFSISFIQQVW